MEDSSGPTKRNESIKDFLRERLGPLFRSIELEGLLKRDVETKKRLIAALEEILQSARDVTALRKTDRDLKKKLADNSKSIHDRENLLAQIGAQKTAEMMGLGDQFAVDPLAAEEAAKALNDVLESINTDIRVNARDFTGAKQSANQLLKDLEESIETDKALKEFDRIQNLKALPGGKLKPVNDNLEKALQYLKEKKRRDKGSSPDGNENIPKGVDPKVPEKPSQTGPGGGSDDATAALAEFASVLDGIKDKAGEAGESLMHLFDNLKVTAGPDFKTLGESLLGGAGARNGANSGDVAALAELEGLFGGIEAKAGEAGQTLLHLFDNLSREGAGFTGVLGGVADALGGIGGKAGDVFAILSKLFGGGGGLEGLLGSIGSLGGLFGFAGGGTVQPGFPAIVGERGPELFIPAAPGRIVNNAGAQGMGTGPTFNIVQHMTFTTDVRNSVRAEILNTAPAIVEASKRAVAEAVTRGRGGGTLFR